jgi:hypothetical protein
MRLFALSHIKLVLRIRPELSGRAERLGLRRGAVSAVTAVSPLAILSMRMRRTPHAFAGAPADNSIGIKNS